MYAWVTALLGALLSLSPTGFNPSNIIGTAHVVGPVSVNGRQVSNTALLTSGDRIDTGAGGVMVLNLSATDRLILGERSSLSLRTSGAGVTADVNSGRMQVNTTHQRLKEVRLTDEAISIAADPGQPREYTVTRLANASYVMATKGSLRMTDGSYGDSETIPEGMVGTAHRRGSWRSARSSAAGAKAGVHGLRPRRFDHGAQSQGLHQRHHRSDQGQGREFRRPGQDRGRRTGAHGAGGRFDLELRFGEYDDREEQRSGHARQ
jgi:hypothetical protein